MQQHEATHVILSGAKDLLLFNREDLPGNQKKKQILRR
jgi:hypothetical protein